MPILWQSIVDALETRLKLILVASGYHTNIGSNVYVWRSVVFQAAEMPGVNIKDGDNPIREELLGNPNKIIHALSVDIDILTTSADIARQGIADVEHAINTDRTLGGLALDIEADPEGSKVVTEIQDENKVAGGKVNITIIYETDKFEED